MLNFVEKSKLLKAIIAVFSTTITIVSFAPIFIELNSTFAILSLVIIIGVISTVASYQIARVIEKFISSQIEYYRKRHIIDFLNFIYDDKEYKEILRRNTPIKDENGKDIGSQTIYSALSNMKHDYFNTLD
jgi:hypothetical protein